MYARSYGFCPARNLSTGKNPLPLSASHRSIEETSELGSGVVIGDILVALVVHLEAGTHRVWLYPPGLVHMGLGYKKLHLDVATLDYENVCVG